jgi:hypothetical protein
MESHITLADELPGIYRSILEVVAPLERTTDRATALRLRMEATEVYSRSWDESGRRRLTALLRRVQRLEAQRESAREPVTRRRLVWHPLRRAALPSR